MKYATEAEAMQSLGIDDWRKLSKDRFMAFASMMPEMPAEVALKVIEQFPSFKEFAIETLNKLEASQLQTLESNSKSEKSVHDAYADVRRILGDELDKENLTADERSKILALLIDTAEKQSQKDSESKRFLKDIFSIGVSGLALVVVAGLAFVGAKAAIENNDV